MSSTTGGRQAGNALSQTALFCPEAVARATTMIRSEAAAGAELCQQALTLERSFGDWGVVQGLALLRGELKLSTVRQYLRHTTAFRNWLVQNGLSRPSGSAIETYLGHLCQSGQSGTRSVVLCAIRAVYERDGSGDRPFTAEIHHHRKPPPRLPMTPQQVVAVAAAAATLREQLAALLINQFSFPASRAATLRLDALQLHNGMLSVNDSPATPDPTAVRLSPSLRASLQALLANGEPQDCLFPSRGHAQRPCSLRTMQTIYAKMRNRAGLPKDSCTATTFRKAACMSLIMQEAAPDSGCDGCLNLVSPQPQQP